MLTGHKVQGQVRYSKAETKGKNLGLKAKTKAED